MFDTQLFSTTLVAVNIFVGTIERRARRQYFGENYRRTLSTSLWL